MFKRQLSFIFLLFGCCATLAGYSQERERTWDVHIGKGNLLQAVRQVEHVTQVPFSYNASKLEAFAVDEKEYNQQPVSLILGDLLSKHPLTYNQQNGIYLIVDKKRMPQHNGPNDPVKIRGQVSNGTENLLGVTVREASTNRTVTTDADGKFVLPVKSIPVEIRLSYVGLEEKTITVTDTAFQEITLSEGASQLEGVVVTALNVKRDSRSIGYLVEKLDGGDVSENKTVNIQTALTGKIPGVDVSSTSNGAAGSKRVTIRGIASISGNNQPLWVVDGIPINTSPISNATPSGGGGIDFGNGLTYINPDDIEEITVLKGNAAAALYGSRASTGVIIVTTKSGSRLGKNSMQVTYNTSYTVDQVKDFTDWQYEYGQGSNGKAPVSQTDALSSTSSWGAKLDGSSVVQFDGQMRPYTAQKDNVKNFYEAGHTFSNTLSLLAHTNNTNFRLSGSYLSNNDIVPNSGFTRNGFSFHSQTKYNHLSVNVVMNYTIEKAENRQRIGGNYSNVNYTVLHLPTNVSVLDMKPGYLPGGTEIGLNDQGIPTNPYFVTNRIHEDDQRKRVNGSLELKYDFTKWLYAKGRLLEDYFDYAEVDYTPIGVIWSPKGGGMNQSESRNSEENYEMVIGTNKNRIANDFTISGFVGGNIFNSLVKSSNINGTVFVLPDIYTINNLSVKYPSTGYSKQRTNSLFFNAELAYKNLFLNFTGRKDWFSTLPLDNNSLFYPSVSLSYILNSRLYPSWVSFAKVRGSFAQVSGGASPYSLNLSYRLDRDNYNGINLQVINNTTVPNADLKPLLSTEYETGLDLGFLNNRLTANLTYYSRRTRQDIVSTDISIASGYNSAILNLGNISNKGVEVSVNFNALKTKNLNWDVTGIFSYNDNTVESLGPNITKLQLAQSKTGNAFINVEKGMAYGQIVGYTYVTNEKGQRVYDATGYPLNDGTVHILGNGNYDKMTSLRNSISWKNINLGFLVDAKFGAKIYSEINSLAVGNGKSKTTLAGRENGLPVSGATQTGETIDMVVTPENLSSYYSRVASITDNFVYDASFVKLREISIGYTLPLSIVSKLHLSTVSVAAVARNLFILYKNTPNMDPESNTTSDNAQGIAATVYPSVRNIGFNLNVTF